MFVERFRYFPFIRYFDTICKNEKRVWLIQLAYLSIPESVDGEKVLSKKVFWDYLMDMKSLRRIFKYIWINKPKSGEM